VLDRVVLDEQFSERNDQGSATEIEGEDAARMRLPLEARIRLAKGLVDGSVTVVRLTPRQASVLCNVPRSAFCARYRKPIGAEASPRGLERCSCA
jgi:hypothetical protein